MEESRQRRNCFIFDCCRGDKDLGVLKWREGYEFRKDWHATYKDWSYTKKMSENLEIPRLIIFDSTGSGYSAYAEESRGCLTTANFIDVINDPNSEGKHMCFLLHEAGKRTQRQFEGLSSSTFVTNMDTHFVIH